MKRFAIGCGWVLHHYLILGHTYYVIEYNWSGMAVHWVPSALLVHMSSRHGAVKITCRKRYILYFCCVQRNLCVFLWSVFRIHTKYCSSVESDLSRLFRWVGMLGVVDSMLQVGPQVDLGKLLSILVLPYFQFPGEVLFFFG